MPTRKSPVTICPRSRASNASSLAPTGSKRKPTRPVASRSRALGTACASTSKIGWKFVLVSAVTVASSASISSLLQFSHWPRGGCFLSTYRRARFRSAACSGSERARKASVLPAKARSAGPGSRRCLPWRDDRVCEQRPTVGGQACKLTLRSARVDDPCFGARAAELQSGVQAA